MVAATPPHPSTAEIQRALDSEQARYHHLRSLGKYTAALAALRKVVALQQEMAKAELREQEAEQKRGQ